MNKENPVAPSGDYEKALVKSLEKYANAERPVNLQFHRNLCLSAKKVIEGLQACIDRLGAEKGMADMGFVSEGAGKEIAKLQARITAAEEEIERLKNLFERIRTWSKAYPLDVFLKPDLKKAHEVLKAAGMTLDAISAEAMRHVLEGVMDIASEALKENKT